MGVLPEVLKGRPLTWYRINRKYWKHWGDFTKAFRRWYAAKESEDDVENDIRLRNQGPTELAIDYLVCLEGLYARLKKAPKERKQLKRAYSGLRPEYNQKIGPKDFESFQELAELAGAEEKRWRRNKNYRPPPGKDQCCYKEFAYETRKTASTTGTKATTRDHSKSRVAMREVAETPESAGATKKKKKKKKGKEEHSSEVAPVVQLPATQPAPAPTPPAYAGPRAAMTPVVPSDPTSPSPFRRRNPYFCRNCGL